MRRAAALILLLCLPLGACGGAGGELQWRVLERYPQSRAHFVQGLEFAGDNLYISSGGYGESRLLRYRFPGGDLLARHHLPDNLFAEGLTLFDDALYQLTWRAGRLRVYEPDTLALRREMRLPGEGWGLTHDRDSLIYSDGSSLLRFLDPASAALRRQIEVRHRGRPVTRLNELEWIDGRIWANVWRSDRIVVIDPADGTVTGYLDLTGLLPARERRPGTDVLNGIALDPRSGAVWVTGKRWPWMYRLEVSGTP